MTAPDEDAKLFSSRFFEYCKLVSNKPPVRQFNSLQEEQHRHLYQPVYPNLPCTDTNFCFIFKEYRNPTKAEVIRCIREGFGMYLPWESWPIVSQLVAIKHKCVDKLRQIDHPFVKYQKAVRTKETEKSSTSESSECEEAGSSGKSPSTSQKVHVSTDSSTSEEENPAEPPIKKKGTVSKPPSPKVPTINESDEELRILARSLDSLQQSTRSQMRTTQTSQNRHLQVPSTSAAGFSQSTSDLEEAGPSRVSFAPSPALRPSSTPTIWSHRPYVHPPPLGAVEQRVQASLIDLRRSREALLAPGRLPPIGTVLPPPRSLEHKFRGDRRLESEPIIVHKQHSPFSISDVAEYVELPSTSRSKTSPIALSPISSGPSEGSPRNLSPKNNRNPYPADLPMALPPGDKSEYMAFESSAVRPSKTVNFMTALTEGQQTEALWDHCMARSSVFLSPHKQMQPSRPIDIVGSDDGDDIDQDIFNQIDDHVRNEEQLFTKDLSRTFDVKNRFRESEDHASVVCVDKQFEAVSFSIREFVDKTVTIGFGFLCDPDIPLRATKTLKIPRILRIKEITPTADVVYIHDKPVQREEKEVVLYEKDYSEAFLHVSEYNTSCKQHIVKPPQSLSTIHSLPDAAFEKTSLSSFAISKDCWNPDCSASTQTILGDEAVREEEKLAVATTSCELWKPEESADKTTTLCLHEKQTGSLDTRTFQETDIHYEENLVLRKPNAYHTEVVPYFARESTSTSCTEVTEDVVTELEAEVDLAPKKEVEYNLRLPVVMESALRIDPPTEENVSISRRFFSDPERRLYIGDFSVMITMQVQISRKFYTGRRPRLITVDASFSSPNERADGTSCTLATNTPTKFLELSCAESVENDAKLKKIKIRKQGESCFVEKVFPTVTRESVSLKVVPEENEDSDSEWEEAVSIQNISTVIDLTKREAAERVVWNYMQSISVCATFPKAIVVQKIRKRTGEQLLVIAKSPKLIIDEEEKESSSALVIYEQASPADNIEVSGSVSKDIATTLRTTRKRTTVDSSAGAKRRRSARLDQKEKSHEGQEDVP